MLSRLNNNYLVLEVWRQSSLLGVSKLPTESIHSAFRDGGGGSEPLESFSGKLDILDLFENTVVGRLDVSLRAGTIKSLSDQTGATSGDKPEKTKPGAKPDKIKQNAGVQTSFVGKHDSITKWGHFLNYVK